MANALMPHRLDLQNDSLREVIEWNFPMEHINYTNFKNLSLETEMRNKIWENESKRHFYQQINNSNSSQILDQNQNVSNDITHFSNENHTSNANLTSSKSGGKFSSANITQNYASNGNYQANSNISTDFSSMTLGGSQHISPTLNIIQAESLIQNGQEYDHILTNDPSSVKEELLEMKSIFTKMAAQTEDLIGFPEPVHLVLKLIKLECNLKEKDATIYNLENTIKKLKQESEKLKEDHEFKLANQQQETKFLKEKIDYKANLEASLKSRSREANEKVGVEKLNEHIEKLKEKIQEMETNSMHSEQKFKQLAHDAANSQQDLENIQEVVKNLQLNEKSHKIEIERYIAIEKEGLERERQDRYLLLVEQNKLKHKVEKLSENCKSYQMKNEELCRIQNELEQECDQFRKLKKMIQDHGLPNHEQLIMLQQQTEMFKDDVLTERKDRERAQAQREKMRRDLEILQSRNQSLQEQVYKYLKMSKVSLVIVFAIIAGCAANILYPYVAQACEGNHLNINCNGQGNIRVVSANYGRTSSGVCNGAQDKYINTNCNNQPKSIDVVRRSCDNKPGCTVEATNGVFGDPCVGTYKYLEVQFHCTLQPYVVQACEGFNLNLNCKGRQTIEIVSANYGRTASLVCRGAQDSNVNCNNQGHSIAVVRKACENRLSCVVQVSNGVFGDPCVGTYKYLEVQFRCRINVYGK